MSAKIVMPNQSLIDRFIEEHEQEMHDVGPSADCDECFCKRNVTVYKITDFVSEETCETISGSCPDPEEFPWIFIDMNES